MKVTFKGLSLKVSASGSLFRKITREFVCPSRDWTIGLSAAALLFFSGAGYIAFDFYTQFGNPAQDSVVEEQPIIYQEKEVIRYVEMYTQKEAMFNELRKNKQTAPLQEAIEVSVATSSVSLAEVELAQ